MALSPSVAALVQRARSDLANRNRVEASQRAAAEARILRPDDVRGDYDAGRLLHTTLGGTLREITDRDLRVFQENARALGKRFKGGITAQAVIDLSLGIDRQRSSTQIRMAVPVGSKGGTFTIATNASAGSKDSRHLVTVAFNQWSPAVASPRTSAQAVVAVTQGHLKFDCDCGRHRFWYRYISTIGKFNAGRDEVGYPKIRNPKLKGIACKHVLRVMEAIKRLEFRAYLVKELNKARRTIGQARTSTATPEDIRAIAESRTAPINARRIQPRPIQRASRSIEAAIARSAANRTRAIAHAQALLNSGLLTRKEYDAIVKRAER